MKVIAINKEIFISFTATDEEIINDFCENYNEIKCLPKIVKTTESKAPISVLNQFINERFTFDNVKKGFKLTKVEIGVKYCHIWSLL